MKIKTYKQEEIDNVAQKVVACYSVAHTSEVKPLKAPIPFVKDKVVASALGGPFRTSAAIMDYDLYVNSSILVTTDWNKNHDVFTGAEVWAARHTPEHKPANLNHNEKQIFGHTIATWAVTGDVFGDEPLKQIAEETPDSEVPLYFHLLNTDVIYMAWQDEEWRETVMSTIAKIEAGAICVSMECLFSDFDYGFFDEKTGTQKVVARNENTAFLTKHLGAYGGTGFYNGAKLGRVLRNLNFVGKGYTEKPANPNSIIISSENQKLFLGLESKSVSSLQDTKTIGDNEMTIEQLTAKVEELNAEIAKRDASVASITEVKNGLETKVQSLETAVAAAKVEVDAVKVKLTEADKTIANYETEKQELAKKAKHTERKTKLIASGVAEEVAEVETVKYLAVADDLYEAISVGIIATAEKAAAEKAKAAQAAAATSTSTDAERAAATNLDTAKPTEAAALAVAAETTKENLKKVRASMVEAFTDLFNDTEKK